MTDTEALERIEQLRVGNAEWAQAMTELMRGADVPEDEIPKRLAMLAAIEGIEQ